MYNYMIIRLADGKAEHFSEDEYDEQFQWWLEAYSDADGFKRGDFVLRVDGKIIDVVDWLETAGGASA